MRTKRSGQLDGSDTDPWDARRRGRCPRDHQPAGIANEQRHEHGQLQCQCNRTRPLSYQWRANGGNLEGATNSTLVIPNVQLADAGTYQAVVFNAAGSMDSSNALFVVRIGPSITNQPTNISCAWLRTARVADNRATFNAGASATTRPSATNGGSTALTFPGQPTACSVFSNVTLASEGAYPRWSLTAPAQPSAHPPT